MQNQIFVFPSEVHPHGSMRIILLLLAVVACAGFAPHSAQTRMRHDLISLEAVPKLSQFPRTTKLLRRISGSASPKAANPPATSSAVESSEAKTTRNSRASDILNLDQRENVEKKLKVAKKLGIDFEALCRTQQIDAAFREIDTDGSGDIDIEELRTVFGADAEDLMVDLDTIERDGKVSQDEWRKYFGLEFPMSGVSVVRAAAKANTEAARDISARGASRTDALMEDLGGLRGG